MKLVAGPEIMRLIIESRVRERFVIVSEDGRDFYVRMHDGKEVPFRALFIDTMPGGTSD